MLRKILEIIREMSRKIPDSYKACVIGTFIGVPIFGCLTAFALALEFINSKPNDFQMYLIVCTCG